LKSAR